MNITLALDDKLVRVIRKLAIDRGTTLTGLVRTYLEELAAQQPRSGSKGREREALERSFTQFQFVSQVSLAVLTLLQRAPFNNRKRRFTDRSPLRSRAHSNNF